jgi:hypothetical protein
MVLKSLKSWHIHFGRPTKVFLDVQGIALARGGQTGQVNGVIWL